MITTYCIKTGTRCWPMYFETVFYCSTGRSEVQWLSLPYCVALRDWYFDTMEKSDSEVCVRIPLPKEIVMQGESIKYFDVERRDVHY